MYLQFLYYYTLHNYRTFKFNFLGWDKCYYYENLTTYSLVNTLGSCAHSTLGGVWGCLAYPFYIIIPSINGDQGWVLRCSFVLF